MLFHIDRLIYASPRFYIRKWSQDTMQLQGQLRSYATLLPLQKHVMELVILDGMDGNW